MAIAEAVPATTLPAGVTSSAAVAAPETPAKAVVTPVVAEKAAPAEVKPAAAAVSADEVKVDTGRKSLLADAEAAKPADAPTDKPVETPADGKPSEIVYALKAPEKSALTADDLKGIEALAKTAKLTPEAAQAIVDRESKLADDLKVRSDAAAKAGVDKLYDTWAEASAKDPVIGGPKWAETQQLAKRALNLDPDFKALIATSPFGNHPKVLAFLAKVGALTREDAAPAGGSVPQVLTKTPAERWYGASTQA